ncbi:MAG TPA: FISUMP domain-containing protein [Parafilimonas sp.]|nr:FISUMP domain-containing protein [Parafilimonas sp.]
MEWDTLVGYLGSTNAGGKLKETGTIEAGTGLWYAPNIGATNSTGFSGVPGGYRDGAFYGLGSYCYIWTSTEYEASAARYRLLYYDARNVLKGTTAEFIGFYVRCVKD